jgi:DNA adenine methylase
MQFNTPLRYPGGKGKLTDFIKLVFEQNNLLDGHYVEPYAGGAGIAITLLLHSYASCVHLNDLNPAVHAFWHSVLNEPDQLCRLVRDAKLNMKEWHRQKAILNTPLEHTELELGFATFFLNRTNRSGIIQGGVIGGKNQDGNWKLDARFNRGDLIQRIENIAMYRSRIRLYNLDAADLIKKVIPSLPFKTLVYLDPPYYVKGKGLYENHYTHDDHVKVSKIVATRLKRPWIVSYDHTPAIVNMYPGFQSIVYGLNYSAQNRYEGAEVMFFSNKLDVPDVENPSKLKAA